MTSRVTVPVVLVENLRARGCDHHPVALVEIGDLLGQGGQRQGIRTKVGLALPIAHHQRRAEPRADQHAGMRAEGNRQRKSPAQLRQRRLDRLLRRGPGLDLFGDQVSDNLAVGLAFKPAPARAQRLAQLAEVLDDAVVDQREALGGMRMGIGRSRRAVSGPAGVGDAGGAGSGIARQLDHQVRQLARRAAAHQLAGVDRADPGRVVAAILHAAQAIDEALRHGLLADDADDATHGCGAFA